MSYMKCKNVFVKQEQNLASCEKSGVKQAVPSVQFVSNSDNSRLIGHILRRNCLQDGLVTFCVKTAFYNGLLKERYKGDKSDRKTRKKTYESIG